MIRPDEHAENVCRCFAALVLISARLVEFEFGTAAGAGVGVGDAVIMHVAGDGLWSFSSAYARLSDGIKRLCLQCWSWRQSPDGAIVTSET